MIEFLHNIAENDDGNPLVPLIFLGIVVITSLIGALSKAAAKSRQRRGQQQPGAGLGPTERGAKQPTTVNQFLEQIRRMAKGQAGPAGPTAGSEPKLQGPLSRPTPPPPPKPVKPLQARGAPGAPPPPPRPMVPRPAGARPFRPPAQMPKQAPVLRPPESAVTAGPRDVMEQLAALAERPQRQPTAVAPTRGSRPKPKPAEKAAKPVPAGVGPAELRAALHQRLAAGPAALREAILFGEVLGQPISMRRHHMRRPGSVGRLI